MPEDTGVREAAAILRGISDRIQRLEDSVGTDEGIPRIIRAVKDTSETKDSVSRTVNTASPGEYNVDDYNNTLEYG